METIIILILLILLIGALPTWPYSANWGYHPSMALTVILIVVALFLLFGHHPAGLSPKI